MIKLNGRVVNFTSFPNGETKLDNGDLILLPRNNEITFKYESDGDLIKLMFVKKYLDHEFDFLIRLTVLYMPYSRMDRSVDRSPFTLKYVSDFINYLDFCDVTIIEPHSYVTSNSIANSFSSYLNFDLLPMVMEEVGFDIENDSIMFPDDGACSRYAEMKGNHVIVGKKVRDFQTGRITDLTLHGDFKGTGKNVIIVDDLSSYGGTFCMSADALREKGFENVYLLVCHAENSIFKGDLFKKIDKIFTTDSILSEQKYWENLIFEKQLKVYFVEDLLKEKGW